MAFITAETRSSIVELAMGMLNQAPSTTLLSTLIEKSTSGSSLQDLADYIATTDAFTAEYPATQTAREFATEMFGKLITGGTLDADINTAVIDLLEGLLIAGTTKAQGFVAVIEFLANPANADHADLGDIAQSFQNRADAAEYFVVTKELGGSTDAELAAAIASVTSDAATLTAAKTAADATAAAEEVVAGQTFTLTTGLDNVSGGTGADSFSANLVGAGATGSTVQPGDIIAGGEGSDTFTIAIAGDAGAAYSLQAVSTTGVETLSVSNFEEDDGATTVDTVLMSGLESINFTASSATGDTVFDNVGNIVDVSATNGSGDLTVTYTAAATTGTQTQNVAVSNMSSSTITVAGVETVNLSSGLLKSTLTDLVIANASTLNITGSTDLKITNDVDFKDDATGVTGAIDGTVDAAAFTGALTLTPNASDNVSITAGSGADTIAMAGGLDKYDVLVGGDGLDTLTMDSAAITTQFTGVSGFEVVAFNDTATGFTAAVDKMGSDVTNVLLSVKDDSDNANEEAFAVTGYTADKTIWLNRADYDADLDDAPAVTITSTVDTAADTVNVKLYGVGANGDDGGVGTDEFGIGTLNVANYETVNIDSSKVTGGLTSNEVQVVTASSATSIAFTGAAALEIGTLTLASTATSIDASAMTGALTLTAGSYNATYKLPSVSSTLNFGTGLNNKDTVVGGAGTADSVTATVSGATATTGALNITDVESVALLVDTTPAVINAANISGVISVYSAALGTAAKTTISNLAAGQVVQMGLIASTEAKHNAVLSLADATGTEDTMTVAIGKNDTDDDIDANLDIAGVETVTISVSTTTADIALDLAGVSATKLVVTGGKAGEQVDLTGGSTKLNKTVTEVDASGTKGHIVLDASATGGAAITVTASADTVANSITGTANADTFTITGATNVAETIAGGAGTDTVNLTLGASFADGSGITAIETVNIAIPAGIDVDTSGGTGFDDADIDFLNVTGGNSLSTLTTGDLATGIKKIDASGFGGNVVLTMAATDTLDSTVEVVGGALATDSIAATYTATATYVPVTTGIEILNVTNASTNAPVLSLTNTDAKTINITNSQAATFAVDKIAASGETFVIKGAANAASITELVLTDATGSADSIAITANGTFTAGAQIKTTSIETVNLKMSSAASIDLSAMTNSATGGKVSLVVTGSAALTVDDANNLDTDLTTIDASAMTGALNTLDGRTAGSSDLNTVAMTIKGGFVADTIHGGSAGDTFTGGTGNDTFYSVGHASKFIFDSITDAANGDIIQLDGLKVATAATVNASWAKVTLAGAAGFSDYLEAATIANGATDADVQYFAFDGNTYIVVDNSAGADFVAGTDTVIELVGVLDLSQSTLDAATGKITLDVDGI